MGKFVAVVLLCFLAAPTAVAVVDCTNKAPSWQACMGKRIDAMTGKNK